MGLEKAVELIKKSQHVAIMGHIRGDSDCYGSAFGLKQGLETLGKNVQILSDEPYPDNLNFLFYYFQGEIDTVPNDKTNLLIVLDSSDVSRLCIPEIAKQIKKSGARVLQIDHHTPGDIADFADVELQNAEACSTCELVFDILKELDVRIDKNTATCLLTGIIGDTSSFQNQNTTQSCMAVASELMKRGARQKTIINHLFGGKDVDILKVWGLAMERLNKNENTGVVTTFLTYDDINEYGISGDAISGIVNFLNQVKGAKMVVLITEEEKGIIKISFRTRDEHMDVAKLAKQLGGGGHQKAAGLSFPGTIEVNNLIPRIVYKQLT